MTNDETSAFRLKRSVDPARDHVRGGGARDVVNVVMYGDYLCPYCRRLIPLLSRLRDEVGGRLVHVFRHFPNERAHPGADLVARAVEAAGKQGRFWEMHDRVYAREPPITEPTLLELAREIGLDVDQFAADMQSDEVRGLVDEDLEEGRANGVSGTPTLFVDGVRYDGAWDFHSLREAIERPVAARVKHAGRVFANLPASGGLVLLLAAAAAIACANSPLSERYHALIESTITLGSREWLSMSLGQWCSEGLLAVFFLLVGLEIRRELTAGALTDRRAAVLPVAGAIGGVTAPALIYLALNHGTPAARGWSIPTATDVAFTLGILALLGEKIPPALRVFVAALAVVDDVLSVLILAIFFPRALELGWLLGSALTILGLLVLNRWRVYATWPYAIVSILLWFTLHRAGVHGALAGVVLAAFLPTQPAPAAAPLLAQAATALAALEHTERELTARQSAPSGEPLRVDREPVWEWAIRNLSASVERLLSPADRVERLLAPWSAYVVLPLFAFSATGVRLDIDLSSREAPRVLAGVVLGLVLGKPLGVSLAAGLAILSGGALAPRGVSLRQFLGAACLCGVADTVALLMADQASLPGATASVAKVACLVGSFVAAATGTLVLVTRRRVAGAAPVTG